MQLRSGNYTNHIRDYCQLVAEGIYIGSVESALVANNASTSNPRINAIVDLSGRSYETDIPSLHILMPDAPLIPESTAITVEKFATGVKFIRHMRQNGNNVLIHCAAGINRSATCIGMYLVSCGWTYKQVIDALTVANQARGVPLLTNDSFRQLLATYAACNLIV